VFWCEEQEQKEKSMKQRAIILAVAAVLAAASVGHAWEFRAPDFQNIRTEAGATFATRHLWRGFDVTPNNHSAVQPYVNMQFGDSGWGSNIWMSRANDSRFENWERIVYDVHYGGVWGEPEGQWAKEWQVGWRYYNHPDGPLRSSCGAYQWDLDFQEVYGRFTWPNLCGNGVVPRYEVIRMWPGESGRQPDTSQPSSYWRHGGGWWHVAGLDYDWTVCGWCGEPGRVFRCSADFVYNGGAGGMSNYANGAADMRNVDNDWSHMFLTICTDIDCGSGWWLTPGFGWQDSWEESVNTQDEWVFWVNGFWRGQ
jgi:hypothetical protein